jgi:hypothetical protein
VEENLAARSSPPREGKAMRPKDANSEAIELAPHQLKRKAFSALPVTKGEVILTSISIVALLASIAYTANWLIIGT